jgi:putative folate metabolism gamma-glutamate ligase
MIIQAIKTHRIEEGDCLFTLLDQYIPTIPEQSIVVITSKIVSVCQGHLIPKEHIIKEDLIKQEADAVLQTEANPYDLYLTIKENILIPSAGIDESNSNNSYILYPKDVQETANSLWKHLREKHNLENIGVIITDSHTTPLRRGVMGIGLAWCGFEPQYSYIGKPDIYDKPLRVTCINIIDALSTSAVLLMGEGNEQTPLALIKDAPRIQFLKRPPSAEEISNLRISVDEDLYAPLLKAATWIKK